MECQVNDEKRQIFPKTKQTWFLSGKLLATYNFAASVFSTALSLFRTILDHGSWWPWWLSQSCDSCASAFALEIPAQNGPNNKHSLEELFWHLSFIQLQHSHPCDWQDQCGSKDEQNYRCMMADVELEQYAAGHEMSYQQSEKRSFSNRNMGLHSENWWLTTTSQLHFFALHHFHLGPRQWCLEIVSKLRFLRSRLCCQDLHRLEQQLWHLASTFSTLAPVRWAKTSAAPKTSKTTTAWWRASHWKKLAMKCQISNEKSQIFPNSNLNRLQKLSATYNFAASLFCTQSPFKIILRPASWWLSQSCHSCASAFAAEISAQMGQKTCTSWKNNFGTFLLYNFNTRTRANWQD